MYAIIAASATINCSRYRPAITFALTAGTWFSLVKAVTSAKRAVEKTYESKAKSLLKMREISRITPRIRCCIASP